MIQVKEEVSSPDLTKKRYSSLSDSSCETTTPGSFFDSSISCRRKYGPTRRASQAGWTEKEDKLLTEAVQRFNGRNWKGIAEFIPRWTDVQCLHRWQKVLNPEIVKGPWSKEEDDCISELVGKYGSKKWSVIAKYLPGRNGKQCRERWHNHLNPAVKKDAWTEQESSILAYYHQIYGNKWAEIARFLPGRTDNAIKNHWNCSVKKGRDLNMPRFSELDLQGCKSPDSCNYEKKSGSDDYLAMQLGETVCLGHKRLSLDVDSACSTVLSLGNTNFFRDPLDHLKPSLLGNRVSSDERAKNLIKPPSGSQFDETGTVISEVINKQWIGSANQARSRDPLCTNSSNHKMNVCQRNEANFIGLRIPHPTTSERMFESPKRPRYGPCIAEERCNSSPIGALLSLSICGSSEESHISGNRNTFHQTSPSMDNKEYSFLCYEPPQLTDLDVSESNESPRIDSRTKHVSHQFGSFSPHLSLSISSNDSSLESFLRNSRMSYKNTPSIIKKKFSRAGNAKNCTGISIPVQNISCVSNGKYAEGTDIVEVKDGSLSKASTSEASVAGPTLERRREHAFDLEWDPTTVRCATPDSASPS